MFNYINKQPNFMIKPARDSIVRAFAS